MPRPRPKFVQKETTRHGAVVWYFRQGDGPRTRLPGAFGSEEWNAAYAAALSGLPLDPPTKRQSGTLRWLCEKYRGSAHFKGLAPSTQRMRSNVLAAICKDGGDAPLHAITKQAVAEGRDRRADTPFAAITYLKTLSMLFDWAVDADYMVENPARGVKRPSGKSNGFKSWTDADVVAYCERWPIGTMQRLAMDLMLFTGLRRGDVILIGRPHLRAGVIEFRANKNEAPLFIPVLPPLQASLDATATGDLTFLATGKGLPFTVAGFGNWFGDACHQAGLKVRAHGLRKRAATIVAEGGGSNRQLKALFGWKSDAMVNVYTRNADARALAQSAAEKLIGNSLSPHPASGAGKRVKT